MAYSGQVKEVRLPDGTIWEIPSGGSSSVSPATVAPLMDGTAAVGTSLKYAREDHVHPSDTSKQDALVSGTNIKTVGGNSLLGSGDIPIPSYNTMTAQEMETGTDTTGKLVTAKDLADTYVNVTGDTMTGNLTISNSFPLMVLKNTTINTKVGETIPATDTLVNGLNYYDGNNYENFYTETYKTAADTVYQNFVLRRLDANDSMIRHGFYLYIDADGTRRTSFSDPEAWRKGLGLSTANPLMDALMPSPGTSTMYAREDHVHPSDYSKQDRLTPGLNIAIQDNVITAIWPMNSKDAAGAVDSGSGNANKVWKTDANGNPAWRDSPEPATANPLMDGTVAVGTSTLYARQDHRHPTDTSRAPTSHASSETTYGIGTTANYGHVRTINNLTTASHTNGYALSAYQGKVLNDKISDLLNVQVSNNPSSVSVASATDTTVANTGSLSVGTYLILAEATFAVNTVGRRALFLATSTTGAAVDRYAQVVMAPAAGAGTQIQLFHIARVTSATTYYLRAYQNSGGALTVASGIRVLKLHSTT